MANKGSIALDASIMPDTMRIHLRGESFSYLPADATEKWNYQLTNVTNSNQVLISGNFVGNAVDSGGSGSGARATGDKVKFLFIKNLGITDASPPVSTGDSIYVSINNVAAAHNGTHCVEIPAGMSWYARCPNTTVAHIQAISGQVNGSGASSVKVQCIVAAILDDL